ncbi:LysM peptidoglycan-binding domain-containing protein [Thermoflavimicrobium dichotomicum]|uniref:Spore germination protein n=1 Tax=Thermoflavimicrobium dichotomicum TaxID=46223 RepID=A0A1I3P575_9BACL|nr:LysM peptidoglycan-binding domain-containing protein [Thermoflavimicrobium dichotomicum]SFJ16196.1 spore germination protein [Thermoflavimicrobium dichotomicum]
MQIHVVQSGETVWTISRRYGVSANQIARANQLPNPNVLVIGQSLVIPTPDRIHVVQPGESLWVIAQRYGTNVQTIMQENRITNPSMIDSGQVLRIPQRPKTNIEVNAYVTTMGEQGRALVRDTGQHLTYVSPFSYQMRPDGSLTPLNDSAVLEAARAEDVAPLMVVTNIDGKGAFSSELVHAVLSSPEARERLITNILETLRNKGYRGINYDLEYVPEIDRELYNQLLRRTVERLRPEGYLTSSAVAPKTRADQEGLLYEAHDYAAHGQILDFVILMTYEWGWAGGPPLAVSPIYEVRKVLDYAVTAIPRNKILMSIPLYGRDWTLPFVRGGRPAATLSPQEMISRAIRYRASIQYDYRAQAPFFHYFDEQRREHEVWFEDARSIQAKFNLVKEYGIRGISYWTLGFPFPQNWLLLEDNFRVRKL